MRGRDDEPRLCEALKTERLCCRARLAKAGSAELMPKSHPLRAKMKSSSSSCVCKACSFGRTVALQITLSGHRAGWMEINSQPFQLYLSTRKSPRSSQSAPLGERPPFALSYDQAGTASQRSAPAKLQPGGCWPESHSITKYRYGRMSDASYICYPYYRSSACARRRAKERREFSQWMMS